MSEEYSKAILKALGERGLDIHLTAKYLEETLHHAASISRLKKYRSFFSLFPFTQFVIDIINDKIYAHKILLKENAMLFVCGNMNFSFSPIVETKPKKRRRLTKAAKAATMQGDYEEE